MYNAEKFYLKIINSIYLNLSRTASSIPFGGNHFLDEVTRGVGELILKEYEEQFNPESTKPSEICKAYLKTLGRQDLLEDGAFQLEDDGDSVVVTMNPKDQEHCIYNEFCREAQKESLLFYCPRLGVLQSVLKKFLGVEYSTTVELKPESAYGFWRARISPVKRRLRTEMVHFVDDTLDIAGERAVLFTKDVYLSFLTAVNEYAPFILKKVLFDTFLGIAKEAEGCYKSPEKSLSVCFEEMKNCGIGMIELVSLDSSAGHAVIRCYQSFEVAAVQGIELYRTPRVNCDLLRGQLSACLSVILKRPIICEEMQCAALDGECCEFHAYPEEENERK